MHSLLALAAHPIPWSVSHLLPAASAPVRLAQAGLNAATLPAQAPMTLAESSLPDLGALPPLEGWLPLLPGVALWALALYLPLSLALTALEKRLGAAGLSEAAQATVLVLSSLVLALAAGVGMELLLGWALGPGWGAGLGLVAALWGLFWALAGRGDAGDDGR